MNTNLIIRLCAYKTCLHAIIIVEMAFFFTFCCNREGSGILSLSMGEKDDTQHLLSSLHAIKNMRNYMWIMNKTLPDPLSSNGAAISIAKLRHRLHCLGEFDANLVLFSWTDKGFFHLDLYLRWEIINYSKTFQWTILIYMYHAM